MKKGKTLLIILGAVALTAAAGIGVIAILFQATNENTTSYYSRIDNSLVQPITPHGGMNYRYSLTVYTEEGREQDLELDTSRVLKEGAFIRIETAPIRGVIRWEEVQYDELPAPVQGYYAVRRGRLRRRGQTCRLMLFLNYRSGLYSDTDCLWERG